MRKLKSFFLVVFSLGCTALFYTMLSHFDRQKAPTSPIRYLAQTGPVKEGLKTDYLAQLLQLSKDCPQFLDAEEAQNILKKSPLMKEVAVTLLSPETLYIDYTLRQPHFILSDARNVAIDETGHYIPLTPFYTPKKLPEVFLGLKKMPDWHETVPKEKVQLVLELKAQCAQIAMIDLSHMDAETLGKREMILALDYEKGIKHYLRLTLKGYKQELSRYFLIRDQLLSQSLTVDLRVQGLAFLNPLDERCDL